MMIAGPYRIPDVDIEALSVYTNRTPSGSVRAPTGPQACWAVEQHHDVLAARVGLDPVEFRWRNLVRDGDEGPTRQRHEGDGAIDTLKAAVERITAGEPLATGRGDRGRVRLVVQRPGAVRRVRPARVGRQRPDRDRRPGERHGCGDGPADPGGRGARDAARGLRDHLPGHRHRAVRRRQLRQPDDVQQRPGGRRGRARGPAPAPRSRRGRRSRQSSPTSSCATAMPASSAARTDASRSPSSRRRPTGERCCSPAARACRPTRPSTTRRPVSAGSDSSRSPRRTFFCHAVRIRVDPATGIVRAPKVVAATESGGCSTGPAPRAR